MSTLFKSKWTYLLLGVLAVGLGVFFYYQKSASAFSYSEVPVKRAQLIKYVEASALVSPQNRLEIKPPVAGRIEEVLVKEGDVVKKGRVIAWISSNERAALLDSVRTQGSSEIKKWEDLYKPTPVIAPINGTIILRNVETGQSFANTDAIFVMADRLTVKAQVDETDIAQIKKTQSAKIILDAYQNDPITGKVVHIAYDATVTNNVTTYEVDVLPDHTPDFMRSGMTSNVSIEILHKENVLQIPLTTLVTDEQGTGVLLKTNGKPSFVPVQVGLDDGKNVEILSGLQDGDIVMVKDIVKKSLKNAKNPFMPSGPGKGAGRR
jgi:membrane fusion protein, macrolide-specific efflux system